MQLLPKGGSAPEILAEAAACGEVDIAAVVVAAAPPGEEDGGVLFGFVFVERPGGDEALIALLLDTLLVELIEVVHLDG